MPIRIATYSSSDDLPILPGKNIFHSSEFFRILEKTSGHKPIMFVAYDGDKVVGKVLAVTRRLSRLFPLRKRTVVYGLGDYFSDEQTNEKVFSEILSYLVTVHKETTTLFEFRNLEKSLSGYKYFRQNGFFPVKWLRVVNSIHHSTLDKWMYGSRKRQIARGLENGAEMCVANTSEEIREMFDMMKKYYSSKLYRYFPDLGFFESLIKYNIDKEVAQIFMVKYKGKIIGGSVCLFSEDVAFLVFSGGMSKSYRLQYPGVLAVWKAMVYSKEKGYRHFEFINAGLPFKKIGYRDFILGFGGMQLSSRRWYKLKIEWLNRLMIKLYV